MNKVTLYILCGLPYSGKTTLTKELVKRFGFEVVSMDKVMDKKGYDPGIMTQEQWDEVYSEGYETLKTYLKEGKSVVLDLGNLKRSERDTARNIADSLGVNHKLIYFDIPKDEIVRRRLKNEETQERGQLGDIEMDRAFGMWEEPTPDEKPIIYNQEMDLDKWIQENIC